MEKGLLYLIWVLECNLMSFEMDNCVQVSCLWDVLWKVKLCYDNLFDTPIW
jgi:hypothetical protein